LFYAKHHGKNQLSTYTDIMRHKDWSQQKKRNVWSKQLYDLVGLYGKSAIRMCREMTRRFIKKGADINWQNPRENDQTIMMYCIEHRYLECVDFFFIYAMEW